MVGTDDEHLDPASISPRARAALRERQRARRRARALSLAALLVAFAAIGLRYAFVAQDSYAYDEATYVDVAQHPWYSAFYPDTVFLRHPPVYFLFLSAWSALVGTEEALIRLPSLLFTLAGVALAWDALRRRSGESTAALGALALGPSFLTLVYGTQATMYPLAFLFASLGLWAHVRGRDRLERAALVLLALTHLFGFVFVAVWLWQRRHALGRELRTFAPALAWLLGATGAALADVALTLNRTGPSLGPLYQFSRSLEFLVDGRLALHFLAFGLSLLLLNPALLSSAWVARRRWHAWAIGGSLLVAALLPGPGFLRYGLLLLPIVLILGLPELAQRASFKRVAALVLVFTALSSTAGAAYLTSSVDPKAGNDVPGRIDWHAAAALAAHPVLLSVAAPSPTALAFYLVQDHAFTIRDATEGPRNLLLRDPHGRPLVVQGGLDPADLDALGRQGAFLIVPVPWLDQDPGFRDPSYLACPPIDGARLLSWSPGGVAVCPEPIPPVSRAA